MRGQQPGLCAAERGRRSVRKVERGRSVASGAGAGRFGGAPWDFVYRLAKRFGSKIEIVNLLEVHPEIGT